MNITIDQLELVYKNSTRKNREKFLPYLNIYMAEYGINTKERIWMFLAQVGHESGELRYVEEIASGDAYDTRTDLGNTPEKDGDGRLFKGRGLIQLTGKTNYLAFSKEIGINVVVAPELVATPEFAVISACWFWKKNNLNKFADALDIKGATKRVNGGYNGLDDRIRIYELARKYIS
jgi:putative chitinase